MRTIKGLYKGPQNSHADSKGSEHTMVTAIAGPAFIEQIFPGHNVNIGSGKPTGWHLQPV